MKKLLLLFTIIICSTFAAKAQNNYVILNEVQCVLQYDIYVSNECGDPYLYTSILGLPGGQQPGFFNTPNGVFLRYVEISDAGGSCDPGPSYFVGYPCIDCEMLYEPTHEDVLDCCGRVTFEWNNCEELVAYNS